MQDVNVEHPSVHANIPVDTDMVPPLFPPEFERRVGGVDLLGSHLGTTASGGQE